MRNLTQLPTLSGFQGSMSTQAGMGPTARILLIIRYRLLVPFLQTPPPQWEKNARSLGGLDHEQQTVTYPHLLATSSPVFNTTGFCCDWIWGPHSTAIELLPSVSLLIDFDETNSTPPGCRLRPCDFASFHELEVLDERASRS